jgi:hypothetical protein
MRIILFALVATLAVGCTADSPLSPSDPLLASVPESASADTKASSQKVTLYFYDDDPVLGGNVNIIGLHVTVIAAIAPFELLSEAETGKLGSVTFSIPPSYTSIAITNGTSGVDGGVGDCYVAQTVTRDLPLRRRDGWIYIHHSGETYPACQ